jgi:hypothetical protein
MRCLRHSSSGGEPFQSSSRAQQCTGHAAPDHDQPGWPFPEQQADDRCNGDDAHLRPGGWSHKHKQVAAAMTVMRGVSGQRWRAIPHTACAITATVTTSKPCSTPGGIPFAQRMMPGANKISAIADGRVKPVHAAKAPAETGARRPNPHSCARSTIADASRIHRESSPSGPSGL